MPKEPKRRRRTTRRRASPADGKGKRATGGQAPFSTGDNVQLLNLIRAAAASLIRQLGQDPTAAELLDPNGLIEDCQDWFRVDIVEPFRQLAAETEKAIQEERERAGISEDAAREALRLNALSEAGPEQLEQHLNFLAGIMHLAEVAEYPDANQLGRALAVGAVLGQRIAMEMFRPFRPRIDETSGEVVSADMEDALQTLRDFAKVVSGRSRGGLTTTQRKQQRRNYHKDLARWLLQAEPTPKTDEIVKVILRECPNKSSDHRKCTWRQVYEHVLAAKRDQKITVR